MTQAAARSIMNDQGSLIGSLNDKECDESIVAAIVSNVWSEFEASQADMDAGKLLSQTFVFEVRSCACPAAPALRLGCCGWT